MDVSTRLTAVLAAGLLGAHAFGQAQLPADFAVAAPRIGPMNLKIADYGATADGKTRCTAAFVKAVADLQAGGGGVLDVPAGDYLTGPFELASNTELRVEKGATIRFSDSRADFRLIDNGYQICLSATQLHDIAITGGGTIDGNGRSWWTEFRAYEKSAKAFKAASTQRDAVAQATPASAPAPLPHRPYMIMLDRCERVLLQGVTLTNSPMFHFVPKDCQDVTIDGVTIRAPADSPNTDGIDPSGQNFHISHCTIDTGDDNIALKPHPADNGHAGCENFLIEHMTFRHGHGMSIGGGSHGGVRNMVVRDCTFDGTDSGVRMKAGRDRGGVAEQLTYENLTMTNVANPVLIISYYPDVPKDIAADPARPITDHTPVWKNILIRNVTATGAKLGVRIVGLAEQKVEHVRLENVNITSNDVACQIIHAAGVSFVNSTVTSASGKPSQIVDAEVSGL